MCVCEKVERHKVRKGGDREKERKKVIKGEGERSKLIEAEKKVIEKHNSKRDIHKEAYTWKVAKKVRIPREL